MSAMPRRVVQGSIGAMKTGLGLYEKDGYSEDQINEIETDL